MKRPKILTWSFWTKKKIIWSAIILIIIAAVAFFIFGNKSSSKIVQTAVVERQNLEQTVLATGQVVSSTDLELGFQSSGMVSWVAVKEGDNVVRGQVLATLNQSSARASLTTAQGSLAQAEANYEKLLQGITVENIKIYEDAVTAAQHDLDSYYISAINTLNDAYTKIYNAYNIVDSIQSSYFTNSDQQGIRVVSSKKDIGENMASIRQDIARAENSGDHLETDYAVSKMITALSNVFNDLGIVRDQCNEGVYDSRVSSTDKSSLDTQKGYINTISSTVTSLQQNISSYKISLQKAQHQLDVQKAPPTQAEVSVAKAQILSAQGQVDSAQAILNNLTILAPSSGTITEVDIKVGEQATALAKAIVLQNISDLHTEADVSEANIAMLKVGQSIDYTFDAMGPDQHYTGEVLTINPASTVISGVVNYKIKGSLENVSEIKPGMTANMTVLVAKKDNVLAVPSIAIINKNNKQYVRVIDNEKNMVFHEEQVQMGLQADGGLVEIISGLNEGQKIISYMK